MKLTLNMLIPGTTEENDNLAKRAGFDSFESYMKREMLLAWANLEEKARQVKANARLEAKFEALRKPLVWGAWRVSGKFHILAGDYSACGLKVDQSLVSEMNFEWMQWEEVCKTCLKIKEANDA